jgi:hypothetical protein
MDDKPIVEKDDQIIFGSLSWHKDTKTRFKINGYGS